MILPYYLLSIIQKFLLQVYLVFICYKNCIRHYRLLLNTSKNIVKLHLSYLVNYKFGFDPLNTSDS